MEEKAVVVLARIELTPCRSGLPCGRFLERRRFNRVDVVIVCSQLSSVKSAPLDPQSSMLKLPVPFLLRGIGGVWVVGPNCFTCGPAL